MLSQLDMRFWLKRAAEELMALGHLVIVARDNVQLYESLKQEFSGEPVTVILDRRQGERRETDLPHTEEHRDHDRRARIAVDEALRARGVVVIAEPGPGPRRATAIRLAGLECLLSPNDRRWTWRRARANLAGSHPTDMSVLL